MCVCVCVCVCSGYGQTGPQATSPGYDSIASAVSGMMHITGPEVSPLSSVLFCFFLNVIECFVEYSVFCLRG